MPRKIAWLITALVVLSACKTSGEVRKGKGKYVDPTNVKTIGDDEGPSAAASAENENLKRQLDIAKGDVESLRFQLQQMETAGAKRVAELEAENKKLIDDFARFKAQQAAVEVREEKPKDDDRSAADLQRLISKDLSAKQYDKALSLLNELVKGYPKEKNAAKAYVVLGLTQYALGRHQDAAITFNQVIEKYPKRDEVAMAWLGQGAAFARLKQKDDAQLFLQEVIKRYPKTLEAKKAKGWAKKLPPSDLFTEFPGWAKL